MDSDEFDDIIEVPLHQRIGKPGAASNAHKDVVKNAGTKRKNAETRAKSAKTTNFLSDESDDENGGKPVGRTAAVLVTPPPPFIPPKKSRKVPLNPLENLPDLPGPSNLKRKLDVTDVPVIKPSVKGKAKEPKTAKPSKSVKDAEKLVNKQTDKSEVNKYIVVVIDPAVISAPPGPDILNLLTNPTLGKAEEIFQYSVESQRIPGLLTWKRKIIHCNVVGGEAVVSATWVWEGRSLVFKSASDVAEMVQNGSLTTWAQSLRDEVGKHHHITLMVYGFKEYINGDKNAQERARKAAIRGEHINQRGKERVSEYALTEALMTLSIYRIVDYQTFDKASDKGWKACAGSVFHQTRAVAEAPESLKKSMSASAGFEFDAKADGKDSISPKNLVEYWKQVIMQITTVSLEKASAIVNLYPSPSHLIRAYSMCGSEDEAKALLANIEIRRVDTIVGGVRRIGDEISRQVYRALTYSHPDVLLNT